ncbi:hypothetical protein IKF43_01945 [Candidatus Saccharibacteria bacterium]|nr:hypothetical protein [Candidatus Saccharibacteria bacterium]
MPGITIHLAAANEYLKNHPDENKEEFINGSIAPDFTGDSIKSHHSSSNVFDSAMCYLRGKVNLRECIKDFDIDSSFGRGYFYHLITDDRFYSSLAVFEQQFKLLSYEELRNMLYHDYAVTNSFFKDKYKVVMPETVKEFDINKTGDSAIIDLGKVCDMIEGLGVLNLDEYLESL